MLKTEEKVLEAARKVFHKKGFSGARMEEIANEAGINKALLHYYFRSKERLFDEVFKAALSGFISKLIEILNDDLPLDMKVYKVVDFYCNTLIRNRDIPVFVLTELRQNPQRIAYLIIDEHQISLVRFIDQLKEEISTGNIRPVAPEQFFVNLMGLTVFPFIAEPLIKRLFDMKEEEFVEFIHQRKKNSTTVDHQ